MSEWKEVKLGEHIKIITGYPFKSAQYTNNHDDVKLLRGDNIAQQYLRWEKAKYWAKDLIDQYEDYFLAEEDVVLAMDRPWVNAGLKISKVRQKDLPALLVQRVARIRGTTTLDTRFLYFLLSSEAFTNYVLNVQTGTGVPHISTQQIKDYKFTITPITEQKKIASILGDIDEKIELNRKMNETLEEMAMTLYKHWFVDFGPFQDGEFVDSELGRIPKGWEVKRLSDISNLLMGQSPKSEFYNEENEGLPFHQGVRFFNERFPSHKIFCTKPLRVAEEGDILISVRAPVGRLNIADIKMVIGRGLCAISSQSGQHSHLLYLIKHLFKEEDQHGSGTIFNSINKKELSSLKVLVPEQKVIEQFERRVNAFDKLIDLNTKQKDQLTQTRDYLLPRLISGEIDLSGAKEHVEEVLT